jgi:hypothetical protein
MKMRMIPKERERRGTTNMQGRREEKGRISDRS